MTVYALIPARGGSKGIPRKNLALIGGRPLISYTIDAARAAQSVDEVFVSTEDNEIAAFCAREGIVPRYRRPAALAADDTGMVETVVHWLDWLVAEGGGEPEVVVLLQPTSPFRVAADIDATVAAMHAEGRESAVSVHEVKEHPYECLCVDGSRWEPLLKPERSARRRQDYRGAFYFLNGAVYAATPEFIRRTRGFVAEGSETALHVMERLRGVDIDEPEDLFRADAYLCHPELGRLLRAAGVRAASSVEA